MSSASNPATPVPAMVVMVPVPATILRILWLP
jgi:hypothetical protein